LWTTIGSLYAPSAGFGFPFADHQAPGAWAAIVASTLWVGRRELGAVLRRGHERDCSATTILGSNRGA